MVCHFGQSLITGTANNFINKFQHYNSKRSRATNYCVCPDKGLCTIEVGEESQYRSAQYHSARTG